MSNSAKNKFIEKAWDNGDVYRLKNTRFKYFYPDRERKTAILLNENISEKSNLNEFKLNAQHQKINQIKSKKIRDFLIGSQKFRPDLIEILTMESELHLKSNSIDEKFESKIRFNAKTDKEVNHRIEFSKIKPLKYLKKGKVDIHLDGEAPIFLDFKHYEVGFLLLGS